MGRLKPSVVVLGVVVLGGLFSAYSHRFTTRMQPDTGPGPERRINLSSYGLPSNFFKADFGTKCAGQIIGYRFVAWLNDNTIAVGFNTSPDCRLSPDKKVDGSARFLVFDAQGGLKAKRDEPYLADGNGEIVGDGEGMPGPGGTLLFRIDSVNLGPDGRHESPSTVLLLDADLNDVMRIDNFLEQTTFVNHALVFQDGFTMHGPRTYLEWDGRPPKEVRHWQEDWPVGTMDRKFGDHSVAYMLCQQEIGSNQYTSSNVIYSGAKRRCDMVAEEEGQPIWKVPLSGDSDSAAIVGVLADGSVAGEINVHGSKAGRLVIWRKDGSTETLPWISPEYLGSVRSATLTMSRYAVSATNDEDGCEGLNLILHVSTSDRCSDSGRWIVFDHRSQAPLVNRAFPKNARAALSPDGTHYASFESGELRIYPLPE